MNSNTNQQNTGDADTTLQALNADVKDLGYTAGWAKKSPSLWKEPTSVFSPRLWNYESARASLECAGTCVSTELSERRNLLMFDPSDLNQYATTRTLVAAYQMLRPGEHARAHRHSPNALRLVLEGGSGVTTLVDGVALPMETGSVLLTPSMAWHSHYSEHNETDAYWIDILDVPLVHQLEPMFFERYPEGFQPLVERPTHHPFLLTSSEISSRLASADELEGARMIDISHPAIPTMTIRVVEWNQSRTHLLQDVANTIRAVICGSGQVKTAGSTENFAQGDVISLPIWHEMELTTTPGTRLLEVSDLATMKALGFHNAQFKIGTK